MIYLAENLKKYRMKKNLTQEEVAEYLGITAQSVSKWERGETYRDLYNPYFSFTIKGDRGMIDINHFVKDTETHNGGSMKLDSTKVKEIMKNLGADLCGIASIDRFADAPEGYHPTDVFPLCKSVISFACRFPVGTLACKSHVPYTQVRNTMTPKLDMIALDFCIEMEKYGVVRYCFVFGRV